MANPVPSQPISTTTSTVHLATHSPEFAKQVIFTDDIIEFVKHTLLNETIDETGRQWIRKKIMNDKGEMVEIKPLMKEEYIYQITSMLRPTITRILILTNMQLEEVNNMILITANDIDYWFAMNWKKAEIEKELYFSDMLSDSLINLIQALAKMSQEGSIQKFFGETYKSSETMVPQEESKRPLVSLPSSFTSALISGGSR